MATKYFYAILSPSNGKNSLFRSRPTDCSIIVAYETRLTENGMENGIPAEPNLLSLCSLSSTRAYVHPNLFRNTSRSLKSRPCCVRIS